jgi:predicted  nucleic acid-binding Zn-ribbon protein
VERLVAIGSEVERLREERKKKRAQFKNLYNKFRKDVEKYVQYEVSYSEEEKKICGRRSSTSEDLISLGLKVPLYFLPFF